MSSATIRRMLGLSAARAEATNNRAWSQATARKRTFMVPTEKPDFVWMGKDYHNPNRLSVRIAISRNNYIAGNFLMPSLALPNLILTPKLAAGGWKLLAWNVGAGVLADG